MERWNLYSTQHPPFTKLKRYPAIFRVSIIFAADRGLNDAELQFSTDEFRTALQPLEKGPLII